MNNIENATRRITQALVALRDPAVEGDFACRATLPVDTLALSIDGFGELRLPVAVTRARALAKISTPAPFGRGRATVVDPKVRHVGEIKASKVRFDRRAWNRELKPVLEAMRIELGLPEGRLSAKLDKLLVYCAGQFFKPHKDTERSDDMVGTLVVVLPSKHKGGALVINHQDRTRRFVIRHPADPLLRLFAFYASCEHEVRPVTEGHRVVLSFELQFKRANESPSVQSDKPLEQALQSWFDPARKSARSYTRAAEKLVYLLDHDYSQRSLAWSRLKGVDHRRAEALKVAAESLGLQTHLALISISEIWSASVDEPTYYHQWQRRSDWFYDEDDEDDENSDEPLSADSAAQSDYELGELIDRGATLSHWRDSSDQGIKMPPLQADDEELCWLMELEHNAPAVEEYEGFMGNYGNTLEREYRRAAVVIWPSRNRYRILARAGGEEGGAMALRQLAQDAAELDTSSLDAAVRSLLEVWPGWHRSLNSNLLGTAMKLSSHVDTPDTVLELLRSFSLAALKPARFKALLELGRQHGTAFCQSLFADWSGGVPPTNNARRKTNRHPGLERGFDREVDRHRLQWLPHFASFCQRVKNLNDDAWHGIAEQLFDNLHALTIESHVKNHARTSQRSRRQNLETETLELVSLFDAAYEINDSAINQILDAFIKNLELYASEVAVAVLNHVDTGTRSAKTRKKVDKLRMRAKKLIQSRAKQAIRAPNDWTIDIVPKCNCALCKNFARFLKSQEQAIDLPLAKERRKHLHRCIDNLDIPVSHSTRRQGRPFALQLRKLNVLFSDSAREHKRELALSKRAVLNRA